MISVLLGVASALGLGTADFMSRFSARRLGAPLTYGIVLLVGSVCSSLYLVAGPRELVWSPVGCALAVAHGISVATMCILLYASLARGPVALAAPIVAAHPVLVMAANVILGLRPDLFQWAAMAAVLAGGILLALAATADSNETAQERRKTGVTILMALGACLAYAALVLTGQHAVPYIGDVETIWIGRLAGLVFVGAVLLLLPAPDIQVLGSWLPFVGLQGVLDTGGYFALLAGSNTASPHITMIVASGFSVVTVLLARLVCKEPVSTAQWAAIALIAAGTGVLSTVS